MSEALNKFFAAWGETDADARKAMIAEAVADGFTYSDPRSGARLSGVDATAEYVSMFSANAPGWSAQVENVSSVNDYHRARVAFGGPGPDGKVMQQSGTYFAETDAAGKLLVLAGFVGAES